MSGSLQTFRHSAFLFEKLVVLLFSLKEVHVIVLCDVEMKYGMVEEWYLVL
jgi:hypothetical protein